MQMSEPLQKSRFQWSEAISEKEWDEFVAQNGGTVFHYWAWRKVLEGVGAGVRPLYLEYRDLSGRILGICPFFWLAGRRLLYLESLPQSYTAGPLISSRVNDPALLLSALPRSVRSPLFRPVATMVVRAHMEQVVDPLLKLGYRYKANHGLLILDLQEKNPEQVWKNGFKKHDRQAVKFYEAQGGARLAQTEDDYLAYLSMTRGSWTFRDRRPDFLSNVRSNFGDMAKVMLAYEEDTAVSGILMLCDRASSTIQLLMMRFNLTRNIHSPVTYVNWKVLNWANENGFRYIDFGPFPNRLSSNPRHHFHKLLDRFETTSVPRYQFVIPVSTRTYALARRIKRIL